MWMKKHGIGHPGENELNSAVTQQIHYTRQNLPEKKSFFDSELLKLGILLQKRSHIKIFQSTSIFLYTKFFRLCYHVEKEAWNWQSGRE